MEITKARLLYISCDRKGHKELPMNKVCVDKQCTHHELLCDACIESNHKGHQIVALNEFIDKLEDIRYSSNLSSSTTFASASIKELK